MTHGGSSVEQWVAHLPSVEDRTHFAADMLRQLILSLKTLHSLGYSHGDIKADNICARVGKDGKFKFSLIDFGVSRRLPKPTQEDAKQQFLVGNVKFCSWRQIELFRPSRLCDLIALLDVSYYVVHRCVPLESAI